MYSPGQALRVPGVWGSLFQDKRHVNVVRLSALCTGSLKTPLPLPQRCVHRTEIRGWYKSFKSMQICSVFYACRVWNKPMFSLLNNWKQQRWLCIKEITTRVAVWFCVIRRCNNGRIFVELVVDVLPLVLHQKLVHNGTLQLNTQP